MTDGTRYPFERTIETETRWKKADVPRSQYLWLQGNRVGIGASKEVVRLKSCSHAASMYLNEVMSPGNRKSSAKLSPSRLPGICSTLALKFE